MRVGVLGGGQLGRMLALEGYPLGLRFSFLEPGEDPSVAGLGRLIRGAYDDEDALRRLAEQSDVVTYEFEKVPVDSVRFLRSLGVEVHPAAPALEMAQDRRVEKDGFRELGVPVADFAPVESREDLGQAVEALGTPAVLKTRLGGYDGKGQRVIRGPEDLEGAWKDLGARPLILERFVEFDRELSILAVRSRDGKLGFYPLVENEHEEGILKTSLAPADGVDAELQKRAEAYAQAVLEHLGYVGVVAIELFQVGDQLLANEMAPRVHNSGHWSLDGAPYSQFENHLRAVCGLPLASTEPRGHSALFNLIGRVPDPMALLQVPGLHLHLYDKAGRPGRKLGHVTLTGPDRPSVRRALEAVRRIAATEEAT